MFRRIRIRTKLAAALAVPLVAFLVMATVEIGSASRAASAGREQTDLAAGAVGPGSLVTHLQNERNRAAIDLIGLGGATELAVDTNEEARALVDDAVATFDRQVDRHGPAVQRTFETSFSELGELEDLRADIDAYDGPTDISNTEFADEVFTRYTTMVEAFFDATSSAALDVDDATLRGGVVLVDAATRQAEMRARLVRDIILLTLTGESDSVEGRQQVAALYDRSQGFDATIRAYTVGPYAGIADATFDDKGVQLFNAQVNRFLNGGDINVTRLLGSVRATPDSGYNGLRNRAAAELAEVASGIRDDAQQRRNGFLAAALFACAAALGVTWTASRSITVPLKSLTEQAGEMAGASLPAAVQQILDTPPGQDVTIPEVAPVSVQTRDEVREVAAALNEVQRSALDLAVEQAVLRRNIADSFVNLGRRNQNLLNRQLEVITDLEREETDPDALDGLFRLDHLATRMRRNAESLLVLAGVDPPRQWTAPVSVSDVVRAALGEVEDYQRVVVRHLDPATVIGSAAADVAHVVAELVENALMFSPPETPVEVKGALTEDGYTVEILDRGMGMTEDDVAQANRRLSGAESFTVAPSRYLGHYVAGHLATRIGLVVELASGPDGGTIARVDLPTVLLPSEEPDNEQPALPPAPAELASPMSEPGTVPESDEPQAEDRAAEEVALLDELLQLEVSADAAASEEHAGAEETGPEGSADDPAQTPSGDAAPGEGLGPLTRRVPGAQRPDAPIERLSVADDVGNGRRIGDRKAPEQTEPRSDADDVYDFLSSFRSGVERGLAAARETGTEES